MGVRRIFSRGATRGIFQNICRGLQGVKFVFFLLEAKKATIFAEILKIQGVLTPFSHPFP